MKYQRLCFLDTETTNVYGNSSAPVQIAAVICDEKGNIIDSFEEKIKTTHKIHPDASKVHGIYAKDLVNCRSEAAVLTDFCMGLKQNQVDCVVTYNGEAFDRPMLNYRCQTLGIPFDFFDKAKFPGIDGYYDCIIKAKKINYKGLGDYLGRKGKLSLVADYFGVGSDHAHDALEDVLMLKNLFYMVDPVVNPDRGTDETNKVDIF